MREESAVSLTQNQFLFLYRYLRQPYIPRLETAVGKKIEQFIYSHLSYKSATKNFVFYNNYKLNFETNML